MKMLQMGIEVVSGPLKISELADDNPLYNALFKSALSSRLPFKQRL